MTYETEFCRSSTTTLRDTNVASEEMARVIGPLLFAVLAALLTLDECHMREHPCPEVGRTKVKGKKIL